MKPVKKLIPETVILIFILYLNLSHSSLYGLTPASSNIYIGAGYFSGEYYNFYTDPSGSNFK